MNSSRVLSLVIVVGLALLVTVPLKLADFAAAEQSLSRHLQQAIVAMLASKGFDIKSSDNVEGVVVDAQHDDCHLQLREVPAQGYQCGCIKDGIQKTPSWHSRIAESSRESHPTLRATISEIWSRFKWHLKIDNSWSPVVSVTAKGACAIAALPWARIATIRTE